MSVSPVDPFAAVTSGDNTENDIKSKSSASANQQCAVDLNVKRTENTDKFWSNLDLSLLEVPAVEPPLVITSGPDEREALMHEILSGNFHDIAANEYPGLQEETTFEKPIDDVDISAIVYLKRLKHICEGLGETDVFNVAEDKTESLRRVAATFDPMENLVRLGEANAQNNQALLGNEDGSESHKTTDIPASANVFGTYDEYGVGTGIGVNANVSLEIPGDDMEVDARMLVEPLGEDRGMNANAPPDFEAEHRSPSGPAPPDKKVKKCPMLVEKAGFDIKKWLLARLLRNEAPCPPREDLDRMLAKVRECITVCPHVLGIDPQKAQPPELFIDMKRLKMRFTLAKNNLKKTFQELKDTDTEIDGIRIPNRAVIDRFCTSWVGNENFKYTG